MSHWRALYNTTVTIQRYVATRDDIGGVSHSWNSIFANVPAAVQPLSGNETQRYAALADSARLLRAFVDASDIKTGNNIDVTPADRVQHGAAVYEILAVLDQAGRGEVVALDLREWRG